MVNRTIGKGPGIAGLVGADDPAIEHPEQVDLIQQRVADFQHLVLRFRCHHHLNPVGAVAEPQVQPPAGSNRLPQIRLPGQDLIDIQRLAGILEPADCSGISIGLVHAHKRDQYQPKQGRRIGGVLHRQVPVFGPDDINYTAWALNKF